MGYFLKSAVIGCQFGPVLDFYLEGAAYPPFSFKSKYNFNIINGPLRVSVANIGYQIANIM